MVSQIVNADKLIIFTDTEGLLYANPAFVENPDLVESIEYKSEQLEEILKTAGSSKGVGGFTTKILPTTSLVVPELNETSDVSKFLLKKLSKLLLNL